MVEINLMYAFYKKPIEDKIIELKNIQDLETNKKETLKKFILDNKSYINRYIGINYKDILSAKSPSFYNKIKFPERAIFVNGKEVPIKAIKLYIKEYLISVSTIEYCKQEITKLKNKKLNKTIYADINKKFNSKVGYEIIHNDYHFTLSNFFGKLLVGIRNSKKRVINWGLSIKNKKAILEKGGIPYLKEEAEKDPKYKGEPWIVHRPNIFPVLHWRKSKSQVMYNPLLRYFKWKPARGNYGIVADFFEYTKTLETPENFYRYLLPKTRTNE